MAVESNVAWTASSSQSWLHLSSSEGDGSSTILIKVAPNETASIDTALVIVKSKVGNCIDTAKVVRHGKTVVNGYACVDLGLKSRTMWAAVNIGADSPELFGDYFAWGEIAPKSNYEWSTYQYYGSFPNSVKLTKYVTDSEFGQDGFVDDISVLEQNDDAAAVLWGNDWSIPSQ